MLTSGQSVCGDAPDILVSGGYNNRPVSRVPIAASKANEEMAQMMRFPTHVPTVHAASTGVSSKS